MSSGTFYLTKFQGTRATRATRPKASVTAGEMFNCLMFN